MTSTEIINKAKKTVYKMKKQTDEKGKPMTCWGGLEEPKQGFPMQNLIDIMEADDELRPKQETLEQIAEKYSKNKLSKLGFINGYKLAQERSYSVEEVLIILQHRDYHMNNYDKLHGGFQTPKEWFEQFKKK